MPIGAFNASSALRIAFAAFPVLLLALIALLQAWAARRLGDPPPRAWQSAARFATGAVVWMVATGAIASTGRLARFDLRPPPLIVFLIVVVLTAVLVARSEAGVRLAEGLPLWALVGLQAFRFPLELVMHQAAVERVMPPQMTYTGRNFDIVTGITAAVLAILLSRRSLPGAIVGAWNVLGALLLANVIVVAVVTTPVFAWFGADALNVWVTDVPFVWLPAVMVPAAIAGHLLVARRLALERRGSGPAH